MHAAAAQDQVPAAVEGDGDAPAAGPRAEDGASLQGGRIVGGQAGW